MKRSPRRVSSPNSADIILDGLKPLVPVIAGTFGRACEVVLHDFRTPDTSIVEIAGDVTHRRIGAPVNEITRWMMAQGANAPEKLNRVTRTSDGRVLKSSATLLRDAEGDVFGLFCIVMDITDLQSAVSALADLVGTSPDDPQTPAVLDDIDHVVQVVITDVEAKQGRRLNLARREDRLTIIAALEERGVFGLQRGVPRVAAQLGLSRATLYSYLREVKASSPRPASARTLPVSAA